MKFKRVKPILNENSFYEITLEEFILRTAAKTKQQNPHANFGDTIKEIIDGIKKNFEIDCEISLKA